MKQEWVDANRRAMVEYGDASPQVRRDLRRDHGREGHRFRPNFWKTLGRIRRFWPRSGAVWNRAMQPGRLDGLTKDDRARGEPPNGCTYCIRSHTAAARKLGMDDEMLGELMAVVGTFNQTNRLADGYQVEVDAQLMAASGGPAGHRSGQRQRGLRKSRVAGRKTPRLPRTRATTPLIGRGENRAPRGRPHRQRYRRKLANITMQHQGRSDTALSWSVYPEK